MKSESESHSVMFNSLRPHGLYNPWNSPQARILEWVAFPFSRGTSQPRIEPRSPALRVDFLPAEPQGKPKNTGVGSLSLLQWIFLTQEVNQGLLHCRQVLYQQAIRGFLRPSTNSFVISMAAVFPAPFPCLDRRMCTALLRHSPHCG